MATSGRAWSPLGRASGFLAQARLDYTSFLEDVGEAPPVAFATRDDLERWIDDLSASPAIEPFGTGGRALRVHGGLKNGGYFDQMWASTRYGRYRALMLAVAGGAYNEEDLSGVDADHVIARTVLTDAPDAWVAIFPVYASSNQGFGRIERLLPKFRPGDQIARLTPAAAFKIFNGRMVSNRAELDLAMEDIRGQIMPNSAFLDQFLSAMHDHLLPHLP